MGKCYGAISGSTQRERALTKEQPITSKTSVAPCYRDSQDEVFDALEDLRAAESRFAMAEGDQVDAAIHDRNRAQARFDAALARARSLFCPEGLDTPAN